ncbi:MAG: reverse transcriptase-like protein [Anaerolineales bacterium]|nr:reverse transcriptase-like protein [Anaerolineales bacterium]
MRKVLLIFDGGSKGNPGKAFGSFLIDVEGGEKKPPIRLEFGTTTNNEAEYLSLLSGLKSLIEELRFQRISPAKVQLEIHGDSRLVINQVGGNWKAKDQRMRAFRDQAQRLLKRFGKVELLHQNRNVIVRALGH